MRKRFFDFENNVEDFISSKKNDNDDTNVKVNLNVRGAIWGAICGDVIGYRYKFKNSADKLKKDLEKSLSNLSHIIFVEGNFHKGFLHKGVLDVLGGGNYKLNEGQLGSLSEIMITLLYSIVINNKNYHPVIASRYYSIWYESEPKIMDSCIKNAFEIGNSLDPETIYGKIMKNSDTLNFDNKTGSFLIRCIPLTILYYYFFNNTSFSKFIEYITLDCKITHPNIDCINIALVFGYAIFLALKGVDKKEIFNTLINMNFANDTHKKIVYNSKFSPKYDVLSTWKEFHFGCAIQSAFYYFMNDFSIEEAFKEIINMGGNTDLNCSIFGALYGAYYGYTSLPKRWIDSVINSDDGESMYLRYENLNYLRPYKIDRYLQKLEN